MRNIRKIPLWIKGGSASLLIFLSMNHLINPLLKIIRVTSVGHIIAEIITAPFLIISVPLYVFYSYIGFLLDMIFDTGIGYESLSGFPWGVTFIKVFNLIYYFLTGVFFIWIYKKIKANKLN